LALLGHDDLLALGDLAEVARNRTAMAAGADHHRRLERALRRLDHHAVAGDARAIDPNAPPDIGAGRRRALEQVVVELATDDPVARRAAPSGLVPPPIETEAARREGLDRERILLRVDLDVGE